MTATTSAISPTSTSAEHRDSSSGPAFDAARAFITGLHPIAVQSLAAMYRRDERVFAFKVIPEHGRLVQAGVSPRYTAITVIGLADEPRDVTDAVLGGHSVHEVCQQLTATVPKMRNLGDVALTLWAIRAAGASGSDVAERRLLELSPVTDPHPTVEVAWALVAACFSENAEVAALRKPLADRLIAAAHPMSQLYPHLLGMQQAGRSHVSCYADLVYPIHALSTYAESTGDRRALDTASRSADRLVALQGSDGQWWWHYDYRTGAVVERFPVYAIHQDAMGPMALFALRKAGGPDHRAAVARGVQWLASAPELGGGSLVDRERSIIWRKVARREPGKLSRYLNAGASALHPALRAPGLDTLFPPQAIDYEDRPYHLGWMLYAWSRRMGSSAPQGDVR